MSLIQKIEDHLDEALSAYWQGDPFIGHIEDARDLVRGELVESVRVLYSLVSAAALSEDPDTASVEARRICRELLGMPVEA